MNLTAKQQLSRNPSNAGYATPLKTYSIPAMENEDKTISVPAQPVYLIDPTVEPIPMGQNVTVRTKMGGTYREITRTGDITALGVANTVPVGKRWLLLSSVADLVCTATVGNRTVLQRCFNPGGGIVWVGTTSAATTAGQTCGYDIGFGTPINTPATAVRRNLANTGNTNVQVRESSALTYLDAGYLINIEDLADIDIADQLRWTMMVLEFDA